MRLIDADRLARNSCAFGEKKSCFNCGKKRTIFNPWTKQSISCDDIRLGFLQMIDREKTIKSIPIEWIKNYANEYYDREKSMQFFRDMNDSWCDLNGLETEKKPKKIDNILKEIMEKKNEE